VLNYPHSVDKIIFRTLMKAYARVGMAEEAELLLQGQMHLWETTQDSNLQPDRISFTTVFDAWSQSGRPEASNRSKNSLSD
jgi:pentatricopeptide repeat protein